MMKTTHSKLLQHVAASVPSKKIFHWANVCFVTH